MLWVVLAGVVSSLSTGPAGKVASTYDEAACAEEKAARETEGRIINTADEPNCSEAPPAVPAVLDCNDARVSLWLGEMIGACDMPKTQLPGLLPAMRAAGNEARVCEGGRCGVDSIPIRPVQRGFDDLTPMLTATIQSRIQLHATPFELLLTLHLSQHDRDRLERPPRAA
jgi:hypothetical protein